MGCCSRGATPTDPASAAGLYVGKHVGEDPSTSRQAEEVGYVVIDFDSGLVNGATPWSVGVGGNLIAGYDDSPPYLYPLKSIPALGVAVASSSGMNSADGGWPVIYGSGALPATALPLTIDEDRLSDPERSHPYEQVSWFAFGEDVRRRPVSRPGDARQAPEGKRQKKGVKSTHYAFWGDVLSSLRNA